MVFNYKETFETWEVENKNPMWNRYRFEVTNRSGCLFICNLQAEFPVLHPVVESYKRRKKYDRCE